MAAYPRGRWRLANPQELRDVMLWPSHILIRHEGVPAGLAPFDDSGWAPAGPAPARTRREAFELARRIATELRQEPERFSELARRYSEDASTRDSGGSFGGFAASQWLHWPQALDVFAVLRPGEVSDVVETKFGFHVFLRRSPPAPSTVSGARIVVAHDTAPWLHQNLARRPIPRRSREQAWALAESIYETARREPSQFQHLVDVHSDHHDAIRGGDFGSWSTEEPTPFPHAVEALQQVAVGEVARPFDSKFGIQVVMRTPERARPRYASEMIVRLFDPALPASDPASQASTLQLLQTAGASWRQSPDRFAELGKQYGSPLTQQWSLGKGSAIAERALEALKPGEVTQEPVLLNPTRYALIRRVAPEPPPAPRVRFELPSPAHVDVDDLFRRAGGARLLTEVQAEVTGLVPLAPDVAKRFVARHDLGARFAQTKSGRERLAILHDLQRTLPSLLGEAGYARYVAVLSQHLEQEFLRDSAARESASR